MPRGDMNLFFRLVPMWTCCFLLFSAIFMARPDSTVSFISSASASVAKENFMSQFSAQMEAQSPGIPVVKVVHHQDLNKKILIALVVASTLLASIFLLLLFLWLYKCRHSKKLNREIEKNSEVTNGVSLNKMVDTTRSSATACKKGHVAVIEYEILEAATRNFHDSNILDECGHVRVYKACFNEKLFAAVKRLDSGEQDAVKEFENEVNWLSKIRHQNIISLLGYCIHRETRLLVYEMMQNGTLESQLLGSSQGSAFTWPRRMKVAVDVARGLEYLHEHCNPPVVHRDLRSSSILLDSNFNAKVSAFGFAVTLGNQSKGVKLSGNSGYIAPEYLQEGKLTDKSDVYSFGVILLELLVGKKSAEKSPGKCQSIVRWAVPQLSDRTKLPSIVDPMIKDTMNLKHLYQVAAVAVLCVQPEPSYRPLITDVLHSLIPLVPVQLGGSLRVS